MSDQLAYKIIPYDEKTVNLFNDLVFQSDLPEELKFYVASSDTRFGYPSMFCICQENDKIVGGVSFIEVQDNGAAYVEIGSVFVTEPYRRRKVGVGIISNLETHAKTKQFEKIKVTTDSQFVGAKEFYQKCGFNLLPDSNFLAMEKKL